MATPLASGPDFAQCPARENPGKFLMRCLSKLLESTLCSRKKRATYSPPRCEQGYPEPTKSNSSVRTCSTRHRIPISHSHSTVLNTVGSNQSGLPVQLSFGSERAISAFSTATFLAKTTPPVNGEVDAQQDALVHGA